MHYTSFGPVLICALLFGCNSNSQVPLRTVAHSQHCPVETPGLSVFRSSEQLKQTIRTDANSPKQRLQSQELENFPTMAEQSWLLVVHMGQQPSAGYDLSLASDTAEVADGTLIMHLQYHRPAADSMRATVITTPCIMVSIKKDDLASLEVHKVVAQAGDQRWEHALTPSITHSF